MQTCEACFISRHFSLELGRELGELPKKLPKKKCPCC